MRGVARGRLRGGPSTGALAAQPPGLRRLPLGDGVFRYAFSGIVQWTDNRREHDWLPPERQRHRAGRREQLRPGIKLKYGNAIYLDAEALNKPLYTTYYTGIDMFGEPCSPPSFDGPRNLDFLQIQRRRLVFDQTELKGSSPGDMPFSIWRWDFK